MQIRTFDTNTSDWLLCVQRTSQHSSEIWVGALSSDLEPPLQARVTLQDAGGNSVAGRTIGAAQWERPFRARHAGFCKVVHFDGLQPGRHYRAIFYRQLDSQVYGEDCWQDVCSGEFTTLPASLPGPAETPFTIGFGSCYYPHGDGGAAAAAFRALYCAGEPRYRPDIAFLTGDQVYLDIGLDSVAFTSAAIHSRICRDYATHWKALGSIMRSGATWMLPDDHEFWNDYPFYDTELIPALLPLKIESVREARLAASLDGVRNIQRTRPVEILQIGRELSVCLADFRSGRTEHALMAEKDFSQILDWARGLQGPGVLVSAQPLISAVESERNLTSYPAQYHRLLEALGSSGHDLVVLTGDVHFGRIAWSWLPNRKGRLIELTSSPLSNLTRLNGVATAVASCEPAYFPQYSRNPVSYLRKRWFIGHAAGCLAGTYPCDRTLEHFMTAGFQRHEDGRLRLEVQGWLVRQTDARGLPAPAFATPFTALLR